MRIFKFLYSRYCLFFPFTPEQDCSDFNRYVNIFKTISKDRVTCEIIFVYEMINHYYILRKQTDKSYRYLKKAEKAFVEYEKSYNEGKFENSIYELRRPPSLVEATLLFNFGLYQEALGNEVRAF